MKLHTYSHIVDDNGKPISQWVTDEEFERREADIRRIMELCRSSIDAMREQTPPVPKR